MVTNGLSQDLVATGNNNADATFGHHSFDILGIGGSQTVIFVVNAAKNDNTDALLDNVSVTRQGGVPEPAEWALMLTGFALAGSALRRRATAAA